MTAAFGLLLGWAAYGLHGTTPLLERATNSVSTWIIWTAAAGALIRARPLAVVQLLTRSNALVTATR
ncbi:hypothetical protein [Streptosporangium sp. H16]|uniref:hypothetical protein n=1 Tax=Streptosporangium sp. H16 TaxID=3444184 RepID=UPI003F79B27C